MEASGVYYSSLHGRGELNQDIREICALKQAPSQDAWWNFVLAVNDNCTADDVDSCWEPQAQKAGFDPEAIKLCFSEQATDIIQKEMAVTDEYQAFSSPTFFVGSQEFPPAQAYDQEGKATLKIGKNTFTQAQYRTPEAIKEAVCAAFGKTPKACSETLPDQATQNTGNAGC